MAGSESKAAKELTAMMETTMQQLQSRFQNLSEQIISKMDEMGTRIDDLEKNVGDLMTQAGAENHYKANGFEERPSWPKH
ncbi:heat shock factor-binding protein 1-like protein 1 [Carassius auratus]|uniref:Heat shock factor-binding protein 1-like protein 1 n=1 Tax=Carassius auratus TaxID=7957 RepID=A0A6P6MJU1_CARAU|nr:heat shock factor-binding protein 1-like [Carassius auratus]XP_052389429.1 heat shock factor-binding protein 1-like protein 1 [Carassius gibelio]